MRESEIILEFLCFFFVGDGRMLSEVWLDIDKFVFFIY